MALSNELGNAGLAPESIRTTAMVTLEKTEAGFAIPTMHLTLQAKSAGCRPGDFPTAGGQG
jgi:osmotically inducible protein OsmC